MALVRRRFTGRRFSSRRPKQRGVWTGFGVISTTIAANTTASWFLWDDISSTRLNLPGKGVHARTLLWWWFVPSALTPTVACTLAKVPTDANGLPPSSLIINPMGWDGTTFNFTPLMEHDLMFYDIHKVMFPSVSFTNVHDMVWHHDIKAKRKIDDTDALLLSFSANGAGQVSFVTRTYVTF